MAVTGSPAGSRSGSVYDFLTIRLLDATSTTVDFELSVTAGFETKLCLVWNGQNINDPGPYSFTIDVTSTPTRFHFDLEQGYDNNLHHVGGGALNNQYNVYGFWDNANWDAYYRDDIAQVELLSAGFILDELVLTDEVVRIKETIKSVTDTITLSDSSTRIIEKIRATTDGIVLDDETDRILEKIRDTIDSIVFDDETDRELDLTRTNTDTITLSESTSRSLDLLRDTTDTIALTDKASRDFIVSLTESISFSEVVVRVKVVYRTNSDTLTISEVADMEVTRPDTIDALTLSDSTTAESGKGRIDTLTLTDSVSRGGSEYTRSVIDILTLTDVISQFDSRPCIETFTPEVALGFAWNMVLSYPYTGSVTNTVTLRAPKFGNTFNTQKNNIVRKSRGGKIQVARPASWIDNKSQKLETEALSATQATDLTDFLTVSAGKKIKLLDWENRLWIGVITTPENEILQGIGNCQYKANFVFEGALD